MTGSARVRPERKPRRLRAVVALMPSLEHAVAGRARRAEDDLPHPNEEAVSTDHPDRNQRPDPERESGEGEEFLPPRRAPVPRHGSFGHSGSMLPLFQT
jgi:hypothetical protein